MGAIPKIDEISLSLQKNNDKHNKHLWQHNISLQQLNDKTKEITLKENKHHFKEEQTKTNITFRKHKKIPIFKF